MVRPIVGSGGAPARAAAVVLAVMAAGCSVVVDFTDCERDADCPRGQSCNLQRHYCEVPAVELCNGVDDDHDGVGDDAESFGVCEPAMHVTGMCRDGVLRCRGGARLECVRRTSPASAEQCNNGLDDDCDGAVDNQATCVQNFPPSLNLPIGSNDPAYGEGDDAPAHNVCLAAFGLDKYEVSVQAYATYLSALAAGGARLRIAEPRAPMNSTVRYGRYLILDDGPTEVPLAFISADVTPVTFQLRGAQWAPVDASSNRLPVVNVTWFGADRYCRWAGKHLPTEAEWFRAVKGADFTRTYPWGNDPVTCDRANVAVDAMSRNCSRQLVDFDALPMGRSMEGVFHLYGNANEWMWDFHDTDPMHTRNNHYLSLPPNGWCAMYPNGPLGPAMGSPISQAAGGVYCQNCRMLRGRNYSSTDLRVGIRRWLDGDRGEAVSGFRCSTGGAAR